jgi:hypothetical protein
MLPKYALRDSSEVGFEVPEDEAPNYLVNPSEARTKKGMPGRTGLPGGDYESKFEMLNVFYNSLPPGSNNESQEVRDIRKMRIITSGADDRTAPVRPETFAAGYTALPMAATDGGSESGNLFFDEVTVDDVTGFAERGNFLDRE